MQTRSTRTAATTIVEITKVLNESAGRIRKTVKRTIATSATIAAVAAPAKDGHPLKAPSPKKRRRPNVNQLRQLAIPH